MVCVLSDWDDGYTGATLVVGRLHIDSEGGIMGAGVDKTHVLLGGGTLSIAMAAAQRQPQLPGTVGVNSQL